MNLMVEFLGQANLGSGKSYLDIAPAAQLIFYSRFRLDAGYRLPIIRDLQRPSPGGAFVRIEYNFFNAF
jgi:hypothetical protein